MRGFQLRGLHDEGVVRDTLCLGWRLRGLACKACTSAGTSGDRDSFQCKVQVPVVQVGPQDSSAAGRTPRGEPQGPSVARAGMADDEDQRVGGELSKIGNSTSNFARSNPCTSNPCRRNSILNTSLSHKSSLCRAVTFWPAGSGSALAFARTRRHR